MEELDTDELHGSRRRSHVEQGQGKHLSTERKVQGGFGFALACLGVIGVVSYLSVVRLREHTAWVEHSHEVITRLGSLFSAMTDAQNGYRGYAVTGDEDFVQPYRQITETAEAGVQRLRDLTADNPTQQRWLDALVPLVDEQLAHGRVVIDLRRSQGFEAARRRLLTGTGKKLHDQIRGLVDKMKGTEEDLLKERERKARWSATFTQTVIIGGGVLAFGFVAVALFLIGQEFAGTRRAEAALREAKDQLETRVQERTVELAQANESLRASETKLQTIVENLAEGVAVSDLDGQLLHFNRAALEIHGFASLDECRRHLTEFADTFELAALDGAVCPVEEWPLARVLRGENLRDLEVRIRRIQTDWRRVFSYGGTLVHGADGQPLMAVVTISDISDRKRAEEALLEARDTLEQRVRERTAELGVATEQAQAADRLKSEFLANMSHELRTPLNAIIGFAELMHDGKVGPVSSDHKEYLGDVLTSARHLLQLINDVLDLSKVEAGKMEFIPEPVQLTQIFAEVRQILQTMAAHKRLTVETDIAPAIDRVIIDPAKLKQVVYNYLSNAIKFTSEKGRITLRALADGSDSFRLEVEDTGIGIAADQIDKLFTEFQQLDASTAKKQQGTGLGLALTKRIVEAQGGHVGVRSTAGQGSVFHAVLPKITARKAETSAEPYTIAAPANGSLNILVVEDNEQDLQWIAKILSEQGHSFDTARTGAEALVKAKAKVYSAILLDLILPDMIGWDILHSIRAEGGNQHTPVIVVTVVTEMEMVRGFPVQDYLTKPLSPQSLIDSLRSAGVQSNGARKKVLVVDDDPNALKIARAALQSSGYEAVCHSRGKSALAAAAETRFDAIVLDILMPEMDGFEFLDRFREIAGCRDTPVIVWTNKDITAKDRGRLERSAQSIALKGQDGIDVVLNELQRHVTREAGASRQERA